MKKQIARWILAIQEYDFKVIHKPGRLHTNADAMLRPPIVHFINVIELKHLLPNKTTTPVSVRELQMKDPQIRPWIDYLTEGIVPSDPQAAKRVIAECNYMDFDEDGTLVRIWWAKDKRVRQDTQAQIVVPLELRPAILNACHDDPLQGAHLGFNKTFQKMRE